MVHALSLEQTTNISTIVERTKLALRFSQSRVLRVTRVRFDAADRRHALEEVVLVLDHFSGLAPMAVMFQTSSSWRNVTVCRSVG